MGCRAVVSLVIETGEFSISTVHSSMVPSAPDRGTQPRRILCIGEMWLGSDARAAFTALQRLGHCIQVLDEYTYFPQWKRRWARGNRRLLTPLCVEELARDAIHAVDSFRPHCLFVFKGQYVAPKIVAYCNRQGISTINYYPDVSFRTHGMYIQRTLPLYRMVFNTKSFGVVDMKQQLGLTRVEFVEHGFDPELHRPVTLAPDERKMYECDLAFIGAWSPKKEAILTELHRGAPEINIKIWGPHWPAGGELQSCITGRIVIGEQYTKAICGSKICLGLLSEIRRGASSGDLITARTFQIPACGVLMMHERNEEALRYFTEDVEVAYFDGARELIEKARHYLSNAEKREAVARQGWDRCNREHRIDERMSVLLASVLRSSDDGTE